MPARRTSDICFDVYKCSRCSFVNTFQARVSTHIQNGVRCTGATVQKLRACAKHVSTVAVEDLSPARRGPKGIDPYSILAHRIPWDDVTTRIDYLATKPEIITKILTSDDSATVLARFFHNLWGSDAPEPFQSVIQDRYCYWARDDRDNVERIKAVSWFETMLRETTLKAMLMFYETYKETLPQEMQYQLDRMWGTYFQSRECMTLADVLSKNQNYRRHRRNLSEEDRQLAKRCIVFFHVPLRKINPRSM